jgi:hypothetical protein
MCLTLNTTIMDIYQKLKFAENLKKGDEITVEHIDGATLIEKVDKVKIDRVETPKHIYGPGGIIHQTYKEVSYDIFIICESCAIYEPHEIKHIN